MVSATEKAPIRWGNLAENGRNTTGHDGAVAPGDATLFGTDAVTTRTLRHRGVPGATFHEVRARSILNRVPGASRIPFEWTVTPYRGCSRACAYFTA